MNVDPKFTKEIQDWLNQEPLPVNSASAGASLLLRIAPRNQAYARYLSMSLQRPEAIIDKIAYELKQHLKYRLDGLTLDEVNILDREVVPEAEKLLEHGKPAAEDDALVLDTENKPVIPIQVNISDDSEKPCFVRQLGRREDHDKLPKEVQQLWVDNGNLYKDIKALFEELKAMNDLPSCQRYDKLQLLASMDAKYFKQMSAYDDATPADENPADSTEDSSEKSVNSARSYLSKNQSKLATLKLAAESEGASDSDRAAFTDLLAKMQQRVDTICAAGAVVGDDLRTGLTALGLSFDDKQKNSEEPKTAE